MKANISDITKEKEECINKLIYLLKMRKNNFATEEEERLKNSEPEIKRIDSTIEITLQGKKLYFTCYEYGFKVESIPFTEEETFEINNSSKSLEYQLYSAFLDFMKELFGTKILLFPTSDIAYDFENKMITIASDMKEREYMDFLLDDKTGRIIIKLRTEKESFRQHNRLTFDWDCSLVGGAYSCFKHLFERLVKIANRQEQIKKRSR